MNNYYVLGARGKYLYKWQFDSDLDTMIIISSHKYMVFKSPKHARMVWLEILNTLKYDRRIKKMKIQQPKKYNKLYTMVDQWYPIKLDKIQKG